MFSILSVELLLSCNVNSRQHNLCDHIVGELLSLSQTAENTTIEAIRSFQELAAVSLAE